MISRAVADNSAPKVFFDVGANVGHYSEAILRRYPSATIHAFDASPYAVEQLRKKFGGNESVKVIERGLSNKAETQVLRSPTQGAGVATFYEHLGEKIETLTTVECITLDKYCEDAGIKEIGLLKVDVEGHELAVLQGALNLLAQRAIHRIQFDGGAAFNSRVFFRDYWVLFKAYNYSIFRVLPFGLSPVHEYRERDETCLPTIYLAERN